MVKHSARPYAAIFHARTLRTSAVSCRAAVALLPGAGIVAGACRDASGSRTGRRRKRSASARDGSSGTAEALRQLRYLNPDANIADPFRRMTAVSIPSIRRCSTWFRPRRCWPGRRILRGDSAAVLAMASADSVSCLRSLSGRVVVVCGAAALRKYRRVCRAHFLLFLAVADSGERGLAYRTGDRRGLGSVWDNLHRHRGRAHALCSARSGAVELAAHRAAGDFAGDRGGIAVLADRAGSDGAGLSALRRSGAAAGWSW